MRSLVLLAAIVVLSGCSGRGHPTLEPEGTITNTWVGDAPAAPRAEQRPAPAPATLPDQTAEDLPAVDTKRVPPPPAADAKPTPSPEATPVRRGGWVRGGSWDR